MFTTSVLISLLCDSIVFTTSGTPNALLGISMKSGGSSSSGSVTTSPLDPLEHSVRRSRKRFLSPGVLRGEQVTDRLRIQEVSASPCLKKQKEAPAMALTAEEFRASMREMKDDVAKRFDSLEGKVQSVSTKVEANATKIDRHETLITDGQKRIEDMRREIDAIKHQPPQFGGPRNSDRSPPEPHEYGRARKSLRIWPVVGNTAEEVWRATGDFLHCLLRLPEIGENQIQTLTRPDFPSGFGIKDEIIVLFKTASTRDTVISASSKLSDRIDNSGRPTAGIRIEVPHCLKDDFNLLNKFGQRLKARHGPGTRRHVKFDDSNRSLFLNMKLPGDDRWSRVDVDLARRSMAQRERIDSQDLEARMDLMGNVPSRPASTSAAPPSRPLSSWTGRRTESMSS